MPPDDGQLELFLPDGGHVVVGFADSEVLVASEDAVLEAIVQAGDSEAALERALTDCVEPLGLGCERRHSQHGVWLVIAHR
jgi:hypothetical protein